MAETGLALLNDAERRTLALLAEGHTAKTIAAAMGVSVHSVNERLRDARRKTGAGSSREIARLVAQENRDKQIGVVPPAGPGESAPADPACRTTGRLTKGMIAMGILLTGGVAAILLATGQQPSAANDPLLADLLANKASEPRDLYAALRAERRDDAWAPGVEAVLRARYAGVHGVSGGALRVTCAATLCEVAGTVGSSSRSLQQLQALNLREEGLNSEAFAVGGNTDARQSSFVGYLRRTATGAPRVSASDSVDGPAISPRLFALRVSFDRPMRPRSFSLTGADKGADLSWIGTG